MGSIERTEIGTGNYIVICRGDRVSEKTPGKYMLASSRAFPTFEDALNYKKGVAPSREPYIAAIL